MAGFIISTLANHFLHNKLGRRGISILGGSCQLVAYIISSLHPPFYGLVIAYMLVGLGAGTKQASWKSFIGGLDHANELLGLLHGSYGLGATLLPIVASSLFDHAGWKWWMVYYILMAMAASDLLLSTGVWWKQGPKEYRAAHDQDGVTSETPTTTTVPVSSTAPRGSPPPRTEKALSKSITMRCLKSKPVILGSIYLLVYVGAEVGLGGWLVTFMTTVRHGTAFASGVTQSGLWAGTTCGRIVLGFVTGRFFHSEKRAAMFYLVAAMGLELMFWLIPNFESSAVCVAFLGQYYTSFLVHVTQSSFC